MEAINLQPSMSNHLFFVPDLSSNTLQLSEEESKHAIRVLRLKQGDELTLTDGKGIQAIAKITEDHVKKCQLIIESRTIHQRNRPYELHLIMAPTKNLDRIEWVIEKATEVGIDQLSFMRTHQSERTQLKLDRFEKIAVSAMKQSKQWFLPVIHELQDFQSIVNNKSLGAEKYIAWCETPHTEFISRIIQKASTGIRNITILIGPEGDFTQSEIVEAKQAGFIPISLGNTILRTETAALFACMALKTIFSEPNEILHS